MQGLVFDIKHCAMHDGPGLRTTIFLKGCPLKCIWCHNPESIGESPVEVDSERRIGNRTFTEKETLGKYYTIKEILLEVKKDLVFYEESGGGVTISGGEPLFQFDFVLELLKRLKSLGIHTAIDTSGFVDANKLKQIAVYTDLFLFDLKQMNPEKHKKFTGVSNSTILSNLESIVNSDSSIVIRLPLIPGYNTDQNHLIQIADYLQKHSDKLKEIHLLPYHNWAKNKYKKLNLNYSLEKLDGLTESELNRVKDFFHSRNFNVKIHG